MFIAIIATRGNAIIAMILQRNTKGHNIIPHTCVHSYGIIRNFNFHKHLVIIDLFIQSVLCAMCAYAILFTCGNVRDIDIVYT